MGGQNGAASRFLGARIVNETGRKERRGETSSFARRKAAKRATRGGGPLNCARGSRLYDRERDAGERETDERKRRR